jgi:hypothetical protein
MEFNLKGISKLYSYGNLNPNIKHIKTDLIYDDILDKFYNIVNDSVKNDNTYNITIKQSDNVKYVKESINNIIFSKLNIFNDDSHYLYVISNHKNISILNHNDQPFYDWYDKNTNVQFIVNNKYMNNDILFGVNNVNKGPIFYLHSVKNKTGSFFVRDNVSDYVFRINLSIIDDVVEKLSNIINKK